MGIEVNAVHRNNPVKEFFHSPKVQAALKVTAVAVAALAALAGVIALSVFVAPAFAAIAIPVTIASILFMVLIAKKNPRQDQEDQLNPAQTQARQRFELANLVARGHGEAVTELVNKTVQLKDCVEQTYREKIVELLEVRREYGKAVDKQNVKKACKWAIELIACIEVLNRCYLTDDQRNLGCDFAGIEYATGLADCLRQIIQKTEEVTSDASIPQPYEFVDLKFEAQKFLNRTQVF